MLHRLTAVLMMTLLLAGAAYLLQSTVRPAAWAAFLGALGRARLAAGCAAVAAICLGVLYVATAASPGRRDRVITYSKEGGSVAISSNAVADYLTHLLSEFPAIREMEARVLPRRGEVDVRIELRLRDGAQIPDLSDALQRRVRETLVDDLGIAEVRHVEIRVKDIGHEERAGRA